MILKNFNPHYPFNQPAYISEIEMQDSFDKDGALLNMTSYQLGGGSIILSPWGSNQSLDAGKADAQTLLKYLEKNNLNYADFLNPTNSLSMADPLEFCVKDLVINSGNQLSLQRHRGREEYWIVKSGILTVIVDGYQIDLNAGEAIFIPRGSTHCMNNKTYNPVSVEELQLGICREADNVRLLDSTRDEFGYPKPRPTYPIRNEVEFRSAQLFAKLANDIASIRGWEIDPKFSIINDE